MARESNRQERGSTAAGDARTKTTRREVLRGGAATAAAGIAGLVAGTRTARAHTCPLLPEEWLDAWRDWPSFPAGSRFLVLDPSGDEQFLHPNESQSRLLGTLAQTPGEDRYVHLAREYVAARLNWKAVRPRPEQYRGFWEWAHLYHLWIYEVDRPQHEWMVSDIDGEAILSFFSDWNEGFGWNCNSGSVDRRD